MTAERVMLVDLKFLMRDRDANGNARVYVRRKGRGKIRLRAPEGTPEFLDEYRVALERLAEPRRPKPRPAGEPARGSFRWLCARYYDAAEFRVELSPRTQQVRRLILDGFSASCGALPFGLMEAKHIRRWRDLRADRPEAANALVKALRQVFKWGIAAGHCGRNPAKDVPYIRTNSEGFHTWTVDEVLQYLNHHGPLSRAGRALGVLLFTGAARGDVVHFGRQHVRDGRLKYRRTKTSVPIDIPVLPELQAVIDATPAGDMTFIVTEFGRPFTAAGFGNRFRKWATEAGLSHCSAHGLRKAGATIAADNGASAHELMSIFGWETLKQADHYTKRANRARLATSGIGRLSSGKIGALFLGTDAEQKCPILPPVEGDGALRAEKA
jgi:integrase